MNVPLKSPKDDLLHVLKSMPHVMAQNKLMAITDREIALSMLYMLDAEKVYLLSFLSSRKQAKIKSELQLQARLCIRYNQYLTAIKLVILKLKTDPTKYNLCSYLRPHIQAD